MRRLLLMLGIGGAVVAALLILFFGYRSVEEPLAPLPSGGVPAGQLPPGGTAPSAFGGPPQAVPSAPFSPGSRDFGAVTQNAVAAYAVDSQNNVTFIQPDGVVAKLSAGKLFPLSSSPVRDLRLAFFSGDGEKLFVSFGSGANPQASVFDVPTKSWQPMNQAPESAAWSPTGRQLAVFTSVGDESLLTTLNFSQARPSPQTLVRLTAEDLVLTWTTSTKIVLAERPTARAAGSVYLFDTARRTLTPIAVDERGVSAAWDRASGRGLLFGSGANGRGGGLRLVDAAGHTLQILNILTLPEKCAFGTETRITTTTVPVAKNTSTLTTKTTTAVLPVLFCAVPRNTMALESAELPDDYLKRALFTEDDFYKIDLATGAFTAVLADPKNSLDGILLRAVGGKLFFVNRYDQKLYAVSL